MLIHHDAVAFTVRHPHLTECMKCMDSNASASVKAHPEDGWRAMLKRHDPDAYDHCNTEGRACTHLPPPTSASIANDGILTATAVTQIQRRRIYDFI